MSNAFQPGAAAAAAAATPKVGKDETDDEAPEQVGVTDIAAVGDTDESSTSRDSDGVPVGRADLEEDAASSGADPDEV